MDETWSIRKKKSPTAPSPAQPPLPPSQALPFRPGDLIMTDQEKHELQVLGVKPGDPLPGDLPERLERARRAIQAGTMKEVERRTKSGHVLKPPAVTPLEELPPEHLREIQNSLEHAKQNIDLVELQQQEMAALGQLDPSVRQAVLAARGGDNGGVELYSSAEDPSAEEQDAWEGFDEHPAEKAFAPRTPPTPPRPNKPEINPPEKTYAGPSQAPKTPKSRVPAAKSFEPDSERRDEDKAEAASKSPRGTCPHCSWNLDNPDPAPPSAGDTMAYVTSIFTDVPFVKVYEFFGGKVRLTLRAATTEHLELCFNQMTEDAKAGRILSVDDFWRFMFDYRLAIGIEKVFANGKTYQIGKAVDKAIAEHERPFIENPADAGQTNRVYYGDTVLPDIVRKLMSTAPMKDATVWQLFGVTWKRFDALVMQLGAKADDPSFWTAIEG